jgi:hypothetical protein
LQVAIRENAPAWRRVTIAGDGRHNLLPFVKSVAETRYLYQWTRDVQIEHGLTKKDYYSQKLKDTAGNTQTGKQVNRCYVSG